MGLSWRYGGNGLDQPRRPEDEIPTETGDAEAYDAEGDGDPGAQVGWRVHVVCVEVVASVGKAEEGGGVGGDYVHGVRGGGVEEGCMGFGG